MRLDEQFDDPTDAAAWNLPGGLDAFDVSAWNRPGLRADEPPDVSPWATNLSGLTSELDRLGDQNPDNGAGRAMGRPAYAGMGSWSGTRDPFLQGLRGRMGDWTAFDDIDANTFAGAADPVGATITIIGGADAPQPAEPVGNAGYGSGIVTYDDGSQLQTFDDGSTVAYDVNGNVVSSTPATGAVFPNSVNSTFHTPGVSNPVYTTIPGTSGVPSVSPSVATGGGSSPWGSGASSILDKAIQWLSSGLKKPAVSSTYRAPLPVATDWTKIAMYGAVGVGAYLLMSKKRRRA